MQRETENENIETDAAEDDDATVTETETEAEAADDADPAPSPAEEAAPSDMAAELAETKDRLLRSLAEAENVRRRATRDVENASKRAIAGFAREMVVVADNLDRALAAVDGDTAANDAVKGLLEGVQMTAREMLNAFERNGIARIEPLGERFDPQYHEAMFEYEDPSKPAGSIGQILEVGYTLHGQSLRPAKVGVTKGGPKFEPKAAPAAGAGDAADKSAGGTAYEDAGKQSGANIDEEL